MSIGFLLAPASSGGGGVDVPTADVVRLGITLVQGDRSLDLTGVWSVLAGAEGLDDLQVESMTEQLTGVLGEVDGGPSVAGRDVWLPLRLLCKGGSGWEQARRDLRTVTNALQGLTTVRVVRPDGTVREITGRAKVVVDSWDVDTWDARGWQVFGVLVHCASPWWRQVGSVWETWASPVTTGWFGEDVGALQLAPDASLDAPRDMLVVCDVETYPTVTISGPAGLVTFAHSSGRSWQIDCTGLTSPVMVVTDPTSSTVVDGAGGDQWTKVVPPADLWPLQPGAQQVTVTVVGYAASTLVTLAADGLMMAAVA